MCSHMPSSPTFLRSLALARGPHEVARSGILDPVSALFSGLLPEDY